jgi:hypothetical protein
MPVLGNAEAFRSNPNMARAMERFHQSLPGSNLSFGWSSEPI